MNIDLEKCVVVSEIKGIIVNVMGDRVKEIYNKFGQTTA